MLSSSHRGRREQLPFEQWRIMFGGFTNPDRSNGFFSDPRHTELIATTCKEESKELIVLLNLH